MGARITVDVDDVVMLLRAVSSAGSLPSDAAVAALVEAVTQFLRGPLEDVPLAPPDRRLLMQLFVRSCRRHTSGMELTPSIPPRERDVLQSLLTGASQKEIAAELGLSVHTVRQYVKSLYRRFRVRSRAELMARDRGARQTTTRRPPLEIPSTP